MEDQKWHVNQWEVKESLPRKLFLSVPLSRIGKRGKNITDQSRSLRWT